MSYLVLARKYRPTALTDVIGQEHVTRTLANAFRAGRVHHAFLFCGPRGVGKTTLARIMGKALNCESGPTATPCGTCDACRSIAEGSAVDYIEMDGASNRGIDAIRDLTESVRYQPAFVRKKVYVIDEVHMLTTEAFNALLKTLEEPPPHVTFILATTEVNKLPITITSRCQRYDVKLVPAATLTTHLQFVFGQEGITIDPGALATIVREAAGSVRDALSLSDQVISFVGGTHIAEVDAAKVLGVADRSMTRALLTALLDSKPADALALIDQALTRGIDEIQITRAIVRMLRDVRIAGLAPGQPLLIDAPPDEHADIATLAESADPARLHVMFERMLLCADALAATSRPRWVLEFAIIDAATAEPLLPLGDLLERLSDVETRIAGGTSGGSSSRGPGGGSARPPAPTPSRVTSGAPPSAMRASTQAPAMAESTFAAGVLPAGAAPVAVQATTHAGATATPAPGTSGSQSNATTSKASAPSAPSTAAATPTASGQPQSAAREASPSNETNAPATVASTTAAPQGSARTISWDRVLQFLEEKRRFSLVGYYQHARVVSETADALTVGFAPDFHSLGELAAERASLDEMKLLLAECTGQTRTIAVKLLSEQEAGTLGARSTLERDRDERSAEKTRREKELREHPMTKKVLETFGAEIREIKTLA